MVSKHIDQRPIKATRCRQCLPLSVVQLKGKHCRKPNCRNGVVDTFGQSFTIFYYTYILGHVLMCTQNYHQKFNSTYCVKGEGAQANLSPDSEIKSKKEKKLINLLSWLCLLPLSWCFHNKYSLLPKVTAPLHICIIKIRIIIIQPTYTITTFTLPK